MGVIVYRLLPTGHLLLVAHDFSKRVAPFLEHLYAWRRKHENILTIVNGKAGGYPSLGACNASAKLDYV